MDQRKRRSGKNGADGYTVATLTSDIANATQARDSYVREAQGKESRLFGLLDGLAALWRDPALLEILQAEGLSQRPELAGTYTVSMAG
jgi:hypothetical protein